MNVRAHDLVVVQRGMLGMLPGANAIGLHTVGKGAYLLIMTSTNMAVHVLSQDLGLGAPELRGSPAEEWLWAQSTSTSKYGTVSVAVIGPHRGPTASGQ